MNVNHSNGKMGSRIGNIYERVIEVLFLVLVTPAVVTGLASLSNLPL